MSEREQIEADIGAATSPPLPIGDAVRPHTDVLPNGTAQHPCESQKDIQRQISDDFRAQRERSARRRIPEDFLEPLDRANGRIDFAAFDRVMEWDGKRSILCKGKSGLGKSRALYSLIRREHIEQGRGFVALDERTVLSRISDARSEHRLTELGDRWCAADILLIDDLDKVRFSGGVIAETCLTTVFGVLKDRMARKRPTMLAMNARVGDVFAPAGEVVSESISRRIRDDWMVVPFGG
jgi:chromosomal replication initiation ATPase DnaA